MNISFYTSRTGMIAQQQGLNIYANNIANVNTVGYKALRPSFAECLYTHQHAPREQWQTGHGQRLHKTDLMWGESSFVFTERPLDYALPGDSFFMTLTADGDIFLTRDGAFQITNALEDPGVWLLVNGFGDFVLDYNGDQIIIPFIVNNEGVVTTDIDFEQLNRMIGVFSVDNNWGLDAADSNRFAITARSGQPVPDYTTDKVQGALEMSGVELAGEMVRIIETQRSYQLNARVLKVSDEIMSTVNNLR